MIETVLISGKSFPYISRNGYCITHTELGPSKLKTVFVLSALVKLSLQWKHLIRKSLVFVFVLVVLSAFKTLPGASCPKHG